MAHQIEYLGKIKLPFDRIIMMTKHRDTVVDASYDTDRPSYHRNRTKTQLDMSMKIKKLYQNKKDAMYFYRYTNPKLIELIPASFWKRFKMSKQSCRAQILEHNPGTFSIPHIDRYDSMIRNVPRQMSNKQVKRLWISLTKPKMGHALFVGDEVAYNLPQGTVLTFNKDVLHSGCNVGHETRYVLTLTGFSA
jgi:hypothetical protein